MVSNGFWHIVSVVKELRPPCPAEWLPNNFATIARTVRNVNTQEQRNLGFPQRSPHAPLSFLEGERYRRRSMVQRGVRRGSAGSGTLKESHRDFGTLAIRYSSAIRRFTVFIVASYRRSPIDDSLGRTRRDCERASVPKIFAARFIEADEETKFITAASYSAGSETKPSLLRLAARTAYLSAQLFI
jgi:hypothetical protein